MQIGVEGVDRRLHPGKIIACSRVRHLSAFQIFPQAHNILTWWYCIASSPPCTGQPPGGTRRSDGARWEPGGPGWSRASGPSGTRSGHTAATSTSIPYWPSRRPPSVDAGFRLTPGASMTHADADRGGAMPRISCGSDRKEAAVTIRPNTRQAPSRGGVMSSTAAAR